MGHSGTLENTNALTKADPLAGVYSSSRRKAQGENVLR